MNVSFNVYHSCPGSSSFRTYVTDSSGRTVASGSTSVNLSAYVNSKEDLYLHVYASSHCEQNVGVGGVTTFGYVNSISLSY